MAIHVYTIYCVYILRILVTRLTQCLQSVHVSAIYLEIAVLLDETLRSILESLYRGIVPPMIQVSVQIVLSS